MDLFLNIIPQLQIQFLPKLLEAIAIREFMDIVADRRFQKQGYYIAWYPVFILWIYGVSVLPVSEPVRWVFNMLFAAATMFLLYKGKWYQNIATSIAVIMGDKAFDYVFFGIFADFFDKGFENAGAESIEVFGTVMLTKLTEMLVVKIARGVIGYRKIHGLNKEDYFLYFLMPTVSVGIMDLLFLDCIRHGEASAPLTYAMLGIIILDIAIFHIMHRMEIYYKGESDLRVLNTNMMAQMENIREIEQTHKRIRQLSHGITTQLSALDTLLRHDKYDEAKEYLKSITQTAEQNLLPIHTNNVVVDALLNQRYITARSKGIKMHFDIQDLQTVKIKTADLVTVLSNGLNNAIEACEQIEGDRLIELKIMNSNQELLIAIQNTVAENVIPENGVYHTKKKDKFSHGLGLEGIRLVTENNNGHMYIDCEDKKFKLVTVM